MSAEVTEQVPMNTNFLSVCVCALTDANEKKTIAHSQIRTKKKFEKNCALTDANENSVDVRLSSASS